jgi:adenylate cyclase
VFLPGFAGPAFARGAIKASAALIAAVHAAARLPIGAGVHSGEIYIGTVEGKGGIARKLSALGDVVNTTSRLTSATAGGEVLISETACKASDMDLDHFPRCELALRGKLGTFPVRVLQISSLE